MSTSSTAQLSSDEVRRALSVRGREASTPGWLPGGDGGERKLTAKQKLTTKRMLALADEDEIGFDSLPRLDHINHVASGRLFVNPSTGHEWICHLGIDRSAMPGLGGARFVAVIGWGADTSRNTKLVSRTPLYAGGPVDLHLLIDDLNVRMRVKQKMGWEPRGSNPLALTHTLVREAFARKLRDAARTIL